MISSVSSAAPQAPLGQQWPPGEPASPAACGPLRCLWYSGRLADALTAMDEFLRTPAGSAALTDFCRARRGGAAAESDARALIEAVGRTAARMRA